MQVILGPVGLMIETRSPPGNILASRPWVRRGKPYVSPFSDGFESMLRVMAQPQIQR